MESEIDNLFLDENIFSYTEKDIKDLEECSTSLKKSNPYISLLKDKIASIDINFELYCIKLERLADQMKDIETENVKLENEIIYQTSIYENLKDLLIKLEIKEDHFICLETEPLDTPEGVSNIENSINILNGFDVKDYDIRVVNEKKEKINVSLRQFYKRFIKHLSTVIVKREPKGDFKLHRKVYDELKIYKDIYAFSKKFEDFYVVLCRIYLRYSQSIYKKELDIYLKSLTDSINSSTGSLEETVEQVIPALLDMYKSIIRCEENFLKKMSIENNVSEIFSETNVLIISWVQDIYYVSEIDTINCVSSHLEKTDIDVYNELQDELRILLGKLKKTFLNKEMEIRNKEQGLERFKKIFKRCKIEDLNRVLYEINLRRIMKYDDHKTIHKIIRNKFLLRELYTTYGDSTPKYEEDVYTLNLDMEKYIIEYVFSDKSSDVVRKVETLYKNLSGDSIFKDNIKKEIFDILEPNLDDEDKKKIKELSS